MTVDHEGKSRASQLPGQTEVVVHTCQATAVGNDQQFRNVWIGFEHRRGGRFNQIRQVSVGEPVAKGAYQRGREDHVANQAQPDDEDSQRTVVGTSTVASSINITGMSSFTGYTRWQVPHCRPAPSFTSTTFVLQAGHTRIASRAESIAMGGLYEE